jgi:hypothetical protein
MPPSPLTLYLIGLSPRNQPKHTLPLKMMRVTNSAITEKIVIPCRASGRSYNTSQYQLHGLDVGRRAGDHFTKPFRRKNWYTLYREKSS